MEEVQEPISPQKRKRRPSVRLGEIGYPASYVTTASYLLESAAQRKKQQKKQQQLLESGSSPVKAPRTRLLDHVAQQKIREEEEQERFEEDHLDAADDDGNAPGAALHVDEHETSFAKTSSSSLELFGDGVCGKLEVAADSRDPAATSAEEEEEGDDDDDDDDANPNSLGDEIQGAIEDGPMRRRGVGKQDMMEQGGTGRQSADNSDMAGENNGGANLVFAAKTSTRQCITLASGGVKGWLCALDLGKYSETFELNEVDNEVLPLLTMEDLREMGVHAVGARRKMFNAIQELQHSYGA
ncbi:unnamed protein product [Sphagnum jensenii]|uniref:SAM domain-containing protein n=1 Tax=Sphagnum jensenii TaxID=128206 RepID=A0ABP1BHU6_9BRYO